MQKNLSIEIVFKDSFYFSRLCIDIELCLKHISDVYDSKDFINSNKNEYQKYLRDLGINKGGLPFKNAEGLKEINKIIFCRVWDIFVLYLKQLIVAAEIHKSTFTKDKLRELEGHKFKDIKKSLHDLNICPKTQPQWGELDKLRKYRNQFTHEHKLENQIKAIHFQSVDFAFKSKEITTETIYKATEYIIRFCKKIDQEFLKHYPNFISLQKYV